MIVQNFSIEDNISRGNISISYIIADNNSKWGKRKSPVDFTPAGLIKIT